MFAIISYWLFSELNYHSMSTRSPLARRVSKQCREKNALTDDGALSGVQATRSHPAGMAEKIQANLRMYNSIRMHLVQGVAHWAPRKFTPLYVPPSATRPARKTHLTAVASSEVALRLGRRAS